MILSRKELLIVFNSSNAEKDLVKVELSRIPVSMNAPPSPVSSQRQTLITDYFKPQDTTLAHAPDAKLDETEELAIWGNLDDEECLASAEFGE